MATWTGLVKISSKISESMLNVVTLTQDYIIDMSQNANGYLFKVSKLPNELYSEIKNRYKNNADMTDLKTDKETKSDNCSK